ncbi:MAG: acyl-phosphate glycerol 3-phosphate acyltransferase, partial [Lactobacillus sp.]|nr:acyl-phosphate glycerol 3-phosphate acyltransferase [Lactobacillus sp.]
ITVVLGHMYTIYYKFKGGKGIATGIGVILTLNWQIGIIVVVFALSIMIVTRYVSLGSMAAAVLFVVLTLFFKDSFIIKGPLISFLITSLIISFFMIFKHRDNIKRLRIGEENKISFKRQ